MAGFHLYLSPGQKLAAQTSPSVWYADNGILQGYSLLYAQKSVLQYASLRYKTEITTIGV